MNQTWNIDTHGVVDETRWTENAHLANIGVNVDICVLGKQLLFYIWGLDQVAFSATYF